jgi:hypothetical protein
VPAVLLDDLVAVERACLKFFKDGVVLAFPHHLPVGVVLVEEISTE